MTVHDIYVHCVIMNKQAAFLDGLCSLGTLNQYSSRNKTVFNTKQADYIIKSVCHVSFYLPETFISIF